MKTRIFIVLEADTEIPVPIEEFKKDLESEISCCSYTYEIKEFDELVID